MDTNKIKLRIEIAIVCSEAEAEALQTDTITKVLTECFTGHDRSVLSAQILDREIYDQGIKAEHILPEGITAPGTHDKEDEKTKDNDNNTVDVEIKLP